MPPTPVDPWTSFLNWLQTVIIPDWGGLISLLPVLLIIGLIGPVLTLLAVYWLYVRITVRRGKVRTYDPEPVPAEIDGAGNYAYPPNAPYCPSHHLIYPPTYRECPVDHEELLVRCPVDGAVRVAEQQLCRTCGTRYQLGVALTPLEVRHGRPPAGGAAVA